jgi:hypothetical protein
MLSFPESLIWLKAQINLCLQTHVSCTDTLHENNCLGEGPPFFDQTTLPTRVLEIGDTEDDIRLVVPTTGTLGVYACLSHCWGKTKTIMATKSTEQALKHNIPWTALSKTFQEAIIVTRQLDIKYIWIDSLCILQDDRKDWHREAANMAAVYQNAFIVLAATRSKDGNGGIFCTQPFPQSVLIDGENKNGLPMDLTARKGVPHWNELGAFQLTFPLVKRAWAFQERLLARRIVHFCEMELVWECREHSTCQCGCFDPGEVAKHHHHSATRTQIDNTSNLASMDLLRPSEEIYWHRIVEQYCFLELSYESDRLPALAGIAEQYQSLYGSTYLAGAWQSSLIQDLLWSNLYPSASLGSTACPSWSWASYGSRRMVFLPIRDDLCRVVKVECISVDDVNPKTVGVGSRLVIAGHLVEARLGSIHEPLTNGHAMTLTFVGVEKEVKVASLNNDEGFRIVFDYENTSPEARLPETKLIKSGDSIFCLAMGTRPFYFDFLMLSCIDYLKQIYRRVGSLSVPFGTWLMLFPTWVVEEAQGVEPDSTHSMESMESYFLVFKTTGYPPFLESLRVAECNWIILLKSSDERTWAIIARLTAQQAIEAEVKISEQSFDIDLKERWTSHGKISKIPKTRSSTIGREWFMTKKNEERKNRGERYYKYLGRTVTIV